MAENPPASTRKQVYDGPFDQLDTRSFPILYVDDEHGNRVVFEEAVEDLFPVHLVSGALEALEFMRRHEVAILVTDQRMPGMTGIELCELARREHPGVKRVLVTAFGSQEAAVEAINRAGVSYFLSKPWSIDVMRVTLRNVAETIHLERRVHALRGVLLDRERAEALAMARAALLHDLANGASAVRMGTAGIHDVLAEISDPMGQARLAEELVYLDEAVEHLAKLHDRTKRLTLRLQSSRSDVRLDHLLNVVMGMFRGQHGSGISLEHHCPEGLTIHADSLDVSRIVMNLVKNAIQAIEPTERPGRVRVDVTANSEYAILTVSDDGPGLPAQIRHRLFQPFSTTRQKSGGTGLGLSICRARTQANDGSIQLLETDEGTTFEVRLPRTG
ncbi:MAG: hybrid sensor histidine kinase/response regulator [Proteobacteria bacterium]|nr:hybrid sensor histidine kinase/response regulator [Pseudomonadota bacterium]MCP4918486.1 hybrid sensor histidine kinase/response regulator [Pseudomonadota bacterium]